MVFAAAATALVALVVAVAGSAWSRGRAADRARDAFAAGDWARALADAERLPELASMAADCRKRLKEERTRIDRSARLDRLLARLHPVDMLIRETRPYFYAPNADIRARIERVERALDGLHETAADPTFAEFPQVHALLGIGLHLVGDNARAEQALLAAVDAGSDDGAVMLTLAKISFHRSQLELMSTEDPQHSIARGWNEKACRWLRAAARTPGGSSEPDDILAEIYAALLDEDFNRAVTLCNDGMKRLGDWAPVVEEFWNVLGSSVPIFEPRRMSAYGNALKCRPHYPWAHFMLGTALQSRRDYARAIDHFDKALAIAPRFVEALNNRGSSQGLSGRFEEALADFDEAVRRNPSYALSYHNRGLTRRQLGRLDDAIADYAEALRLNPKYALAHYSRARALLAKGDENAALADYDACLRLTPRDVDALVGRALIRLGRRDPDAAIEDATAALDAGPNTRAFACRAAARKLKGDRPGAIADTERALRTVPADSPDARALQTDLDRLKRGE